MSNRQARREQQRTTRASRSPRPGGARGGRPGPSRGSSGGTDFGWLTQPFTLIVIALVVVLVAALGIYIAVSGGGGSKDVRSALDAARADLPLELANGNKLGKDDAPVKLTQFEDFQCPFCLRYTSEQEPTLVSEYVKAGKLQIIYENFPALGRESLWAANAAYCAADQNKFWQFHNKLFSVQASAGQLDNEKTNVGRFDFDKLKGFARDVGIEDTATFDQCVDSSAHEQQINDELRKAKGLGITGTPGFLLNGRPMGTGAPKDLADWRKIIDEAATASASGTLVPQVTVTGGQSGVTVVAGTPAATAAPVGTPAPNPTR